MKITLTGFLSDSFGAEVEKKKNKLVLQGYQKK